MATLPCEDGAGSLNNPNGSPEQIGTNNPALKPYVPYAPNVGEWQLSGIDPDNCANNDQLRQEQYVAETLNISGAPINVYKLLGVHEQGDGDITSKAKVFGSQSYPGYPITGLNGSVQPWRSIQQGAGVAGAAYLGLDFGIKLLPTGASQYEPPKTKWTSVGSLQITQSNDPTMFARQVRVEIADGACEWLSPQFSGVGNGTLAVTSLGDHATQGTITAVALTPTTFNVYATLTDGTVLGLNTATVGVPFFSIFANFTINTGSVPYSAGDMFSVPVVYAWKRLGIFNLIQSPLPQALSFQKTLLVRAVRAVPTMFTGSGSWEVQALTASDSVPTNINNIQDLFFNENRDRDYAKVPLLLKAQYQPTDSISDLSKFGLNILDQYSFTVSFASMVSLMGRPIVVGDIIEVIPEMQYDQNLLPVRKFLEVTDTSWASEGYSTSWKPTVFRFAAQQALPSQETRDIFGTLDTTKYLTADSVLDNGIAQQLNLEPLITAEELAKEAANKVPERGSDDNVSTGPVPEPPAQPVVNIKGNPPAAPGASPTNKPNIYIEDGIPKDGSPYGEGYKLPDSGMSDGDYFRLYYPPEMNIAPRLMRYSVVKNRWLYLETDRRSEYSSHKPSVRNILQSATKQGLGKKTV